MRKSTDEGQRPGGLSHQTSAGSKGARLETQSGTDYAPDGLACVTRVTSCAPIGPADGPWATKLSPVAERRPFNEMMEGLYARLSPVCASGPKGHAAGGSPIAVTPAKEVALQVMVPSTVRRQVAPLCAERGESMRTVVLRGLRAVGVDIAETELIDRRGRRKG
jgi:hypothetical protein